MCTVSMRVIFCLLFMFVGEKYVLYLSGYPRTQPVRIHHPQDFAPFPNVALNAISLCILVATFAYS